MKNSSVNDRFGSALVVSILAMLIILGMASPARAAAGDLDPTFGGDGKVVTQISSSDSARDLAVQSDGKIVAVGQSSSGDTTDLAVTRYNPNGDLDPTFDGDGKFIQTVPSGEGSLYAVAMQSDGKIVAAGASGSGQILLLRLNANGSLDTSFGGDGIVTTTIDPEGPWGASAKDVIVQPDGKVVVAGTTDTASYDAAFLARYNPNGSLDTTFSGDGVAVTPSSAYFRDGEALVSQPDGKIVMAGGSSFEFGLARYNPNGSLDTTFGGDGIVMTSPGANKWGNADGIALQPDGKIVAAGHSGDVYNDYTTVDHAFHLIRYNPNGSLDTTFGSNGMTITSFGTDVDAFARDVVVQTNGKIVAAGTVYDQLDFFISDFAVARYQPNGSLDPDFGAGGKLRTDFGTDSYDVGYALALQTDGKLVMSGSSDSTTTNRNGFALARYVGDGAAPPPPPAAPSTPDLTAASDTGASTTDNLTKDTTPTFTGTAEAGSTVKVLVDGVQKGSAKATASGTYSVTTSALTPARHSVSATATDASNNTSAASAVQSVAVDTVMPTVSGMFPSHTSITRDTTPTIKATVKDNLTNLQKANIKLYVNNVLISPTKYSYGAATDALLYNSPRLALGKKTVKIVATDAAGNVGIKSWYFTIR